MSFGDESDDRPAGGLGSELRYWFWVFRRRFWLFAAVAALLSAAGLGTALVLPPVYEARASLLMESQQIPSDLVRSTVNASALEQIEVIKQRLLTRETMLEIAARHAVFADAPGLTPTERVDRMREAIRFEQRVLGTPGGRPGDTVSTAFSITFRADSGAKAAAVVGELVTRVLRQSAELRRGRAETTSDYFRQEVTRLGDELARAEARIVAFQEENREALPESLDYRRTQLDLLGERLQRFELERLDLDQERASLLAALGEGPGGPVAAPPTESARQLAILRRALIERRAILTDTHPDIRALELRIRALEAVVAAEAAAAAAEGAAAPVVADPAVRELRRRLDLTETRIAYTDEILDDLKAQRDELERSLLATPNVQMEFATLQRGYDMLEARYRTALEKLAEAEAGEQLEDKRQGERLEVIENASVPEEPVAPNRRLYAAAGLGGGVAGGLGLIVLLEMMSGVVRRPEDLARLGREPAAVIPYIATPGERRWLWLRRLTLFAVMVGGTTAALWSLHTYYLPLETIGERILDRTGLSGALDLVRRRFGL